MKHSKNNVSLLSINNDNYELQCNGTDNLLITLRNKLSIISPKYGCGKGICGACSVLIDGVVSRSCQLTVEMVLDKKITTLEGLFFNGKEHPLKRAFIKEQAFQCGYCTNGMIITAASLLNKKNDLTETEISNALNSNICRCGAHRRIIKAVIKAASEIRKTIYDK
jgi:nicotinate dehydrogenase subunit A